MLSKGGKGAMATVAVAASAVVADVSAPAPSVSSVAATEQAEACCDACADTNSSAPCEADVASSGAEDAASSAALDSLCDIIDSNPSDSAGASSSVRAYCRDRRNRLAKKGKLGLSGTAGRQARKSLMRQASGSTLNGKALAKMQREDRCRFGRGDTAECRPSGRVRPGSAPDKVEEGTTLAGQSVTGTQVEKTEKVTGNESGTCRAITGTEYLGVEQFAKFCSSVPAPAAAKVALSETSHGQLLTGSNTAGSEKVTGDEVGSCKSVTGSQYLGAEHFGAVCGSQRISAVQDKVVAGRTEKNMRITGVDEARDNAVTGSESGSAQRVTGSDYIDVGLKKTAAKSPAKVALSHTAAGIFVSGGESSRIAGVTGDEHGSCGRVTGTEYVSSERFQGACGRPPEGSVAKVGVDASRAGLGVTGNLVDRSENVTGNEPGSCQRVTGSQYSEARAGMCAQRSGKVQQMHTLQGGSLTGTEASSSPKLTGDNRGSCSAVTGSEYISQEYFQQNCSQVPAASGRRTGMSHTWNNQLVSGVQTGHAQPVTGDEQGICNTITGSRYAAREQASEFCAATAVAQGEQRLGRRVDSMPVSGMVPRADERLQGNFQRGACQDVSGTPYQRQQETPLCNVEQQNMQQRNMHHLAQAPINQALPVAAAAEAAPYKAGFSVQSPAQAAWQQSANNPVHSSVYAVRSSITGVVNKAEGVVSGTPEFRHQQELSPATAAVVMAEPEPVVRREGVTGEGSESGTRITGDDWSRGGHVTGTEGMFSAQRNQTQRGVTVERTNIGAYALKDRQRPEVVASRVTGGSGTGKAYTSTFVTLSGGASA
jgi:hypothetical protein